MPTCYVRNLISLIAAGVLVSAWFLFYTDWFEIVGGLLALGGILSWLAFVSKILPEERIKELQKKFDHRIMCNPTTWIRTLIFLALVVIVAGCFGTIELKSRARAGEYLVHIRPARDSAPEKDEDYVSVSPGGSSRTVRWAFWRNLVVHVKGYPTVPVTLIPFCRRTLVVPDSFAAPVLLLRPTPDLIDVSREKNNNKTLLVAVKDTRGNAVAAYTMRFDGTAVWVGCDDDVMVPAELYAMWQLELTTQDKLPYLLQWARPHSLFRDSYEMKARNAGSPSLRLMAGQTLTVTLFKDDTKSEVFAGPFEVPVETRARWEDFPQVKDLHWK